MKRIKLTQGKFVIVNNCKEDNLNTLCLKCNLKINKKKERKYWTKLFKIIMYEKRFA